MAIKFFEPFTEEKFCTVQLQLKNLPHYDSKNCSVVAGVSVSLQRTQVFGMVDVIVVMISCFPSK
jgi:hypothetical protein